jgi:hypothetical protein
MIRELLVLIRILIRFLALNEVNHHDIGSTTLHK